MNEACMWSFICHSFQLAQYFQGPSRVLVACISSLFWWLSTIPLFGQTTFVYSFFCWWPLCCFHFLAIMNNAAMNITNFVFTKYWNCTQHWWYSGAHRCFPRGGIAWSYGKSIFWLLRNLHTPFHRDQIRLHSHQLGFFFAASSKYCLCFFDMCPSYRCVLVSQCVSICISLVSDDKYFFLYLLTVCISSLEKCLFSTPSCFLIFFSFLLTFMSTWYIFGIIRIGFWNEPFLEGREIWVVFELFMVVKQHA